MAFRNPRGTTLGNQSLSAEELAAFLRSTPYCTLSFVSVSGYPGCVPVNFAWDGDYFYVHSAMKGERFESAMALMQLSMWMNVDCGGNYI